MSNSQFSYQAHTLNLQRKETLFNRLGPFGWMVLPTVLSFILLASVSGHWTLPDNLAQTYNAGQATAQLFLQAAASLLGFIQITTVCRLFGFATRLHFQRNTVTLERLQFWVGLANRRIDWSVKRHNTIVLAILAVSTVVPAAIWAGALTPVPTTTSGPAFVKIPQYANMTFVQEYPSQITSQGPIVRSTKGVFSYSVGMRYLTQLLSSAATATTLDGSPRNHTKFDNSNYAYVGRSFGAGSSVGLLDDELLDTNFIQSYSYQEPGYRTSVDCVYNATTNFTLTPSDSIDASETDMMYVAHGRLPNTKSPSDGEYSRYFGYSENTIVAIGVAFNPSSTDRYLAFASGENYQALNATQCLLTFEPALFDVNVDTMNRFINVTYNASGPDIEPSRNLTQTATRQFELIANDLTNLYTSVLGEAFNNSIQQYTNFKFNSTGIRPSIQEASLVGIQNSVAAMADDMLACYASAQLMVANDFHTVGAEITLSALRPGQDIYIYAIFGFNILVLAALFVEAVRTRCWQQLLQFDHFNASHLILASSATPTRQDSLGEVIWKHESRESRAMSDAQKLARHHVTMQTLSNVRLNTWRVEDTI